MTKTIKLYGQMFGEPKDEKFWAFDENQDPSDTHMLTISNSMIIPIPPKMVCTHKLNTYAFNQDGMIDYRLCLNCGRKLIPPPGEWTEVPFNASGDGRLP